jgi:hypothetical protein
MRALCPRTRQLTQAIGINQLDTQKKSVLCDRGIRDQNGAGGV